MQVQTINGLMNSEELEVKDVITLEDNARVIATEWFSEGILVRRDVSVNILRGVDLNSQQYGA